MNKKILTGVTSCTSAAMMLCTGAAAQAISPQDGTVESLEVDALLDNGAAPFYHVYGAYPDGSYFSKTGKACSCHGGNLGNPCSWNHSCDCINYDSSIQCVAFAKYVFYNLRGYKWENGTTTQIGITNATATTAKNALYGVPMGTYVLVRRNSSSAEHSLSIIETTSTTVTVYDANSGYCAANNTDYSKCKVRYLTLKWEKFAEQYKYIIKTVE